MDKYYRQLRANKKDVQNSLKIGSMLLNISSILEKIDANTSNVSSSLGKIDANTCNVSSNLTKLNNKF